MQKRVVSLFDESGNALRPWAEAGYECYALDIVNENRTEWAGLGSINYRFADLTDKASLTWIEGLSPVFIMGFPPCTDLAVCGAKHFPAKKLLNPGFQEEAVALAKVVAEVGTKLRVPWFLENPVSRLATLWRKPDHYFNPCDFGGYLPEGDIHPRWPQFIVSRDAYKKKTCLWSGNGFTMPAVKPVEPVTINYENGVKGSIQFAKLGGKSAKTKQIRSETPRGFALACFLSNGLN